jgi:hypothetical protein
MMLPMGGLYSQGLPTPSKPRTCKVVEIRLQEGRSTLYHEICLHITSRLLDLGMQDANQKFLKVHQKMGFSRDLNVSKCHPYIQRRESLIFLLKSAYHVEEPYAAPVSLLYDEWMRKTNATFRHGAQHVNILIQALGLGDPV